MQKVNVMMFNELEKIHKSPSSKILERLKPVFEFKHKDKVGGLTREQLHELNTTNKYIKDN